MIVPAMSSEELANEILKDHSILLSKAKYLTKKVRREAIKTRNKDLKRIFEYKSKQKNDWLILVDYNQGDPLILPVVYYLRRGFLNAVVIQSKSNFLVHYSSHFFERYNERFLKNAGLSNLELLKVFLPGNNVATYDIILDSEEYKNRVLARFEDGVGLGESEKLKNNRKFVSLKTYISLEMIKPFQEKHFESISGAFTKHWKDFYEK